ncbi:MAG TPA: hypothetical protein VGR00_03000 [Thermoanaerobaculia bacterium]|nr:hypothetical protein [Thermoanaerobaculia bacterium]
MPRAYGSDRLEAGPAGRIVLTCAVSKGWQARRAKTPTSVEHPGTAVRWEEEFFEVLSIEPAGETGVVYTLTAWDEVHVFRVVDTYDEAAEKRRAAERRDAASRRSRRKISIALAPLAGLLPAHVQESLELEYNASPTALTLASAVPLFLFGAFCAIWMTIKMFAGIAGGVGAQDLKTGGLFALPDGVLILGQLLLFESSLRIVVAWAQGRPMGSLLGVVPYEIYRAVTGKKGPEPLATSSPLGEEPTAERALHDAMKMREPLLTFLSADEQERLRKRFDFDPIRTGKAMAWLVLVFASLHLFLAFSALRAESNPLEALFLLVGLYFVVEQAVRLKSLSEGRPKGSVLALVARPFARRLLDAAALSR